jgi:DNA-binding response OmpR family regulator
MGTRILVIDHDPAVHATLREAFERSGFAVDSALDGGRGLRLSASAAPVLVVLEPLLPDMPVDRVLRELRRRSAVPILVLSAADTVVDRVHGLDLGADDYMVKPFAALEVLARADALLRRAPHDTPTPDLLIFDDGRLEIDTHRREVRVDSTLRAVTRTEFDLLLALAEQPGRVQSRAKIALRLRGDRTGPNAHVVDAHVRNLRRKIEDDPARPRRIETIRGAGYRIGFAAA